MFSMQPLMCPRVHLANGRLGRSSALNLCQHLTKALCYSTHTYTNTYGAVHIHTESVTHTRSHPYMLLLLLLLLLLGSNFRQLIDLRGSMAQFIYNYFDMMLC